MKAYSGRTENHSGNCIDRLVSGVYGTPRFTRSIAAGPPPVQPFARPGLGPGIAAQGVNARLTQGRRVYASAVSIAAPSRSRRASAPAGAIAISPQEGTRVGRLSAQSPMRFATRVLRSVIKFSELKAA